MTLPTLRPKLAPTFLSAVLLAALALQALPPLSYPAFASPAPPQPDTKVDKALLKIRAQLLATPRAEARANAPRFRALCDNWGYPLVVDVAGKSDVYQPSELCADARKREGRE